MHSDTGLGIQHNAPVDASSLAIYGDGSDGDVTVSGTTTMTRDMHYNNLTAGVFL